jgi:hypothetical protein
MVMQLLTQDQSVSHVKVMVEDMVVKVRVPKEESLSAGIANIRVIRKLKPRKKIHC